jgi:hypothetical protein
VFAGLLIAGLAEDSPESAKPAGDGQEAHAELQRIRDGLSRLLDENTRLKNENAQLRKENQQLRRLLAERAGADRGAGPANPPTAAVPTNAAIPGVESTLTYWISTSNRQRHNSRCRYFKTTEGRLGGPDEGKACKLCGG